MNSGGTSADKGRRKFHPTADRLVHAVLICLVCFLSYSNTFNVPFQFDDLHNISEKPYVRDINMFFDPSRSSQDSSFVMRSVAYITFAVNYWIHGNDVVGYHILNTAIHLLNGFLVYFLVLLTFRTSCLGSEKLKVKNEKAEQGPEDPSPFTFHLSHLFPLAVALLFVSHPVQTQAVTYIVQRLASLATLFYLLSLLMYIKWRLGQQEPGDRSQETEVGSQQSKARTRDSRLKTGSYYFLSLISAVLAMKTKEIAFTLPLVIALYEFMFFGGGLKKRILYLVPLLLTMLIIPLGLISIGKPTGEIIGDVSDATKVGTDISRWDYLFSEFRVIVTYIRLLFFPVNQNLDYDYPVYHSFSDPNVFLSFLLLVSIFGLGVYLAYRSWFMAHRKRLQANETLTPDNELSAMSYQRLIAFGIFWFFITLFVESSVIPIADVIFEHRLYLPSVGFFIAVTAVLLMVRERLKDKGEWVGKAFAGVLLVVVFLLSAATYARNTVWQSQVGLWEDVARKSPMKARTYNGLGLAYQEEGRFDNAVSSFLQAVTINPSYAVAYNSLGSAYFRKNLFDRAAEGFSRAIALDPGNAIFYNNRGLAYAALSEIDMAITDYLKALSLDPDYAGAYHNLGVAFHAKGIYERAVVEYTRAIDIEADNAIYYNNRGLSYAALRSYDRAIADYTKSISLKPDFADAFTGRGVAYGELGRFDAAVADFTRAVSLAPSSASAYVNRAAAYARMQNISMALSDFQRACQMGNARGCEGANAIREK